MKFKKQFVIALLLLNFSFSIWAQTQPVRDFSKETARPSQDWVKDAVIYEIFPRQYSNKGDFNSITNDLDRLKNLGVTVLWLMPIHPIGQEKKKGTIGSPYAVQGFLRGQSRLRDEGRFQTTRRGSAQTRFESHH